MRTHSQEGAPCVTTIIALLAMRTAQPTLLHNPGA